MTAMAEKMTAEQRRDELVAAVFDADAAWYADIESAELKAAYKAAKAEFRSFETDAIARGATETCSRCGGEGGWKGWPGFTCFKCGGNGREPMRKMRFQVAPNTRRKREAEHAAEMAEKDAAFERAVAELGDVGVALVAARDEVHEWNRLDEHGHPVHDRDEDRPSREAEFRADLAAKLWKYGSLSEAQVAAVARGMARESAQAAEREAAGPLAEGTYEIVGEVASTKWQEGSYGSTFKMLVKLDNGNKVWGTVPRALDDAVRDEPRPRVAFTAEVSRSQDDEHFGFFSRPRDARVV